MNINNSVWFQIKADCYRYSGNLRFREFITNRGLRFTSVLRKASKHDFMYIFYKWLLRNMTVRYGYEISENTKIGYGLALMHLGGIAINPLTEIGNNCTIYKGVTIGGGMNDGKVVAPKIGNMVWIGANATIVGGVSIGDNVMIASNSFVNKNIPSNSLVLGNPAVVKPGSRICDYVQYILSE